MWDRRRGRCPVSSAHQRSQRAWVGATPGIPATSALPPHHDATRELGTESEISAAMSHAIHPTTPERATVLQYLPLVDRVARRMARRLPCNVALDDLVGAGSLGLIDAVRRYDPARASSFAAYAELRIRGAILDHLRALDWLPRGVRASVKRGESESSVVSVDDGTGVGFDGFATTQPSPRSVVELRQRRASLAAAIGALPARTRRVLGLYYMDELTLREIGDVLGVTESRVCQLHAEAVVHLKQTLRHDAAA